MKLVHKIAAPKPAPPPPMPEMDHTGKNVAVVAGALVDAAQCLATAGVLQHDANSQLIQLISTIAARNNRTIKIEIIRDKKTGDMTELVVKSS